MNFMQNFVKNCKNEIIADEKVRFFHHSGEIYHHEKRDDVIPERNPPENHGTKAHRRVPLAHVDRRRLSLYLSFACPHIRFARIPHF